MSASDMPWSSFMVRMARIRSSWSPGYRAAGPRESGPGSSPWATHERMVRG